MLFTLSLSRKKHLRLFLFQLQQLSVQQQNQLTLPKEKLMDPIAFLSSYRFQSEVNLIHLCLNELYFVSYRQF